MPYLGLSFWPSAFLCLALLLLSIYALRKRPFFLIILAALIFCRMLMGVFMQIPGSPLTFCACFLGAFKDFALFAPLALLAGGKRNRRIILFCTLLLLTLNIGDVIYAREIFTRLRHVMFENLDVSSLGVRPDLLALGAGLFVAAWFACSYALRHTGGSPLGSGSRKALWLLCVSGLVLMLLGIAPNPDKTARLKDYFYSEARQERLKEIAQSSCLNFLRELFSEASDDADAPYTYTPQEAVTLATWGLGGPRQANLRQQAAYDRVILVFVESLSYDFLTRGALRVPAKPHENPPVKSSATPHENSAAKPNENPAAKPNENPEAKPGRNEAALPAPASGGLKAENAPTIMPFYVSLLKNHGLALANYHSSAYSTDEALYAALASRPDFEGDVRRKIDMPTIFSLAREKGFETAMFQGSTLHYRNQLLTMPGIMKVGEFVAREQDFNLPPEKKPGLWGDSDARTFEKALIWLKERKDRKVFMNIMTINTHPPFYDYEKCPVDVVNCAISRAFFSTDEALKNFMDALEAEGLLDEKTLLVITADHAITHGGKEPLDFLGHEDFEGRHIPLLFYSRNMAPFAGLDARLLASAVDLAPTLGDLLALPAQQSYYGKSLFAPGQRYELAMNRSGVLTLANSLRQLRIDLRDIPADAEKLAIYKWYANRRFGINDHLMEGGTLHRAKND